MNIAAIRQSSGWTVTAPLTIVAIVYLMLVWLPINRELNAMQNEVTKMEQFVNRAADQETMLPISLREFDQAKTVAARWEKASPRKRQFSTLYEQINALAQDAGLTVERLDPQPVVAREKIQEIPITVVGSGVFGQVYEFLRNIEGLPMTVWVKSMKLEKKSTVNGVQCQMDLVVFANNS
jgi:Tfp pilus assembly protein PilO